MLIFTLAVSAFLVLIAGCLVGSRGRYMEANIAVTLIGAVGCGLLASPLVMASAVLIVLTGLVCKACSARFGLYFGTILAVTVGFYLVIGISTASRVKKRADLATRYPFESMRERLAYESNDKNVKLKLIPQTNLPKPGAPATKDGKNPESDLFYKMEQRIDSDDFLKIRAYSLKEIHSDYVTQFMNASGFGVGRQMRPDESAIKIEEPQPIPLSGYDYTDKPAADSEVTASGQEEMKRTGSSELNEGRLGVLHREGLFDFVNPRGFGYIENRDRVAGFQPHRFSTMPKLTAPLRWIIQDLELVSLLKHDEPVAYVSKNLPRMDELREAKTRPLDAFERDALEVLRRGEDLKVQNAPR
jgi:hypothetical protein